MLDAKETGLLSRHGRAEITQYNFSKIAEEEVKEIKAMIKAEIDEAVKFAEESPFPDPSELWTDNYLQEDYPFLD